MFTAHYWQCFTKCSEVFDTLDDAVLFLKAGADWGELSYESITDGDGNVLMDRDALFEDFNRREGW